MSTASRAGVPAWARGPLRPFRHSQYRWLAAAVLFELAGEGIWVIAIVWQVIGLGGGPVELSFAMTGLSLGMVATVLVGGVAADRVPQRTLLLAATIVRLTAVMVVAALALAGALAVWHLALASVVVGAAIGVYFPAYSALLPSIVDGDELLAANGMEGFLRPTVQHAAGPALGGMIVAAASPGWALTAAAVCQLLCLAMLAALRPVPLRRAPDAEATTAIADLRIGVRYMVGTPWFLGTLVFACIMLLVVIGPMEVLIPYVIESGGGDARGHSVVLAAYGMGGAFAALAISMVRLPRRYLTTMNLMWGVGCLPLLVVGLTTSVPAIAAALFVVGALVSAPMVLWGTLLQKRVPPHLLGRASSLDFFVSLLLMPVSMAVAGPAGAAIGVREVFVVAAFVPVVVAVLVIWAARMPADEIAHPLR